MTQATAKKQDPMLVIVGARSMWLVQSAMYARRDISISPEIIFMDAKVGAM